MAPGQRPIDDAADPLQVLELSTLEEVIDFARPHMRDENAFRPQHEARRLGEYMIYLWGVEHMTWADLAPHPNVSIEELLGALYENRGRIGCLRGTVKAIYEQHQVMDVRADRNQIARFNFLPSGCKAAAGQHVRGCGVFTGAFTEVEDGKVVSGAKLVGMIDCWVGPPTPPEPPAKPRPSGLTL